MIEEKVFSFDYLFVDQETFEKYQKPEVFN
jgi:hypothetical protein